MKDLLELAKIGLSLGLLLTWAFFVVAVTDGGVATNENGDPRIASHANR